MAMIKVECGRPIVLVDDCENNLYIGRRTFAASKLNNRLITLQSGAALISYMQELLARHEILPTLILLDIEMPGGLSGLETLEQLRAVPAIAKHTHIIMLSSSVDPEHRRLADHLGASAFQARPACSQEYLAFINSLL